MKPRTSFTATAAVPSSKYGSNNTCGGSSINSIFSPIGITTGPVKEGLVSQIASKFQQQVGVANSSETEIEKISAKRKVSEPIRSVHRFNPTTNSDSISNSGDHVLDSNSKFQNHHLLHKSSTNKIESSGKQNRSESHQARFHNARAMFEKMGSADDLDSIPASPTTNYPSIGSGKSYRALSVGSKPTVAEPYFNNRTNPESTISSNHSSNSGMRSRSTSPFGGSRSSSQSSLKQSNNHVQSDMLAIVRSSSGSVSDKAPLTSIYSPTTTSSNSSVINVPLNSAKEMNGESKTLNGNSSKYHQNKDSEDGKENVKQFDKSSIVKDGTPKFKSENQEGEYSKFMESKLRKTSDYKSPFMNSSNDDSNGPKTSIGSIGRPNIKELTNKQRNWFSNFERGKTSNSASTSGTVTPENVESARRTSVKQDNVPNLLSGFDKNGIKNDILFKGSVPDATPTPSSNLNQPGDRRPINVLSSSSSDSIEDYLKSWKGGSSIDSVGKQVESTTSSVNSDSKASLKQINRLTGSKELVSRSSDKNSRPPVLSPKPNPDVVKRFSFNKNKQAVDSALPNSTSLDEISVSRGMIQNKNVNKKSEVIECGKSETPKKPEKNVSGSIVRKLSEEYNSKIRKDDQKAMKPSDFPTGVTNRLLSSKEENHYKKRSSDAINNSNHGSSKSSSINHSSIIESIKENNEPSILEESDIALSDQINANGLNIDKAKCNSKINDLSQGEKEFVDIEKEFDRLAKDTDCSELDIFTEEEILEGNIISSKKDNNVKDKVYFEEDERDKSNEIDVITHGNNSTYNISSLNNLAESVPFIDANGSSRSLTSQDTVSTSSKDDKNEKSRSNKLDLQLQKIYRPNSEESNKISNGHRADLITSYSEKQTASSYISNLEDDKSTNKINNNSPNITTSCSVDTVLEKKSDNDQEFSGDEFQDEIQFDPTISSGHLGFDKEGDFRNTPITVGGARDAITTPSQMDTSYLQNQTSRQTPSDAISKDEQTECKTIIDESLPLIMSPKEEENLLSNNIIERKGVLSDKQAEEVKALLTPDRELPPLPNELEKENNVEVSASESSVNKSIRVDSAINKLDSLVYSASAEAKNDKSSKRQSNELGTSEIKGDNEGEDKTVFERPKPHEETFYDEIANVHYYSDGHYWFEIPGLDSTETANLSPSERLPPGCYKKPGKLRFSTSPMKQYSTFAIDDYDRRNDDVDPVAASGT